MDFNNVIAEAFRFVLARMPAERRPVPTCAFLWMSSLGVMKAPYYRPHPLVINDRCYLNTRCCQCAVRFSALTSDGYLGLFSLQAPAKIVSGDRCLLFKKPSATLSSAAIIARLAGACHYSALLNVKGGASCPAGCLPSSPKGQFVFL